MQEVDYLVLGSGLSSLAFASLMAKKGHSVKVLEAHEHFGGYAHTFAVGDYRFNAQLHYVTSCGEGDILPLLLNRLNLDIKFHRMSDEGFDRVYCADKCLLHPNGLENFHQNLKKLSPEHTKSINAFMEILYTFRRAADVFPRHQRHSYRIVKELPSYLKMFKYRNATLQDVFDQCDLPKILQGLIAGQLINYMLPPNQLSFLIWATLFNCYCKGAYYPEKHFEHFVESLVDSIKSAGGELIANEQVVSFIMDGKAVKGVTTQRVNPKTGVAEGPSKTYYAKTVICNFDPKKAADMIGIDHFSKKVRRALDYDYSWSSFVLYGVVKGLDLRKHGFGNWNVWHCQEDQNAAFEAMYHNIDYSKPHFAMNCRSLHTDDNSHCLKDDSQIFQICTVGNYEYWRTLKLRDHRAYYRKKQEVLDQLLDVVEKHYIPEIRSHLALKMAGTPTTNAHYVWAPQGGSYGVNLTPRNFQYSRKLSHETSLPNFYFCSAASGAGGFGGTITTGVALYEKLTGDFLN
ncbi:MAG: NAD(P)/FAD-dependent oxidoreductase [Chlamydiales bacterium]|nr:NAD(P)/FAD-dependent oxidoreductase [Chlamydiales bacterium]